MTSSQEKAPDDKYPRDKPRLLLLLMAFLKRKMNACVANKRPATDGLPCTPETKRFANDYAVTPNTMMPPQMMYPFYPGMFFDPNMAGSMDGKQFHNFMMQTQAFMTPTPSETSHISSSSNESGIFDGDCSQSSSPSSDHYSKQMPSNNNQQPVSEDTLFCEVQGRLNLVGNIRSYPVTIAEIRRRVGSPENMNSSTLGALLRKSKIKNGGSSMRDDLEKYGIHLSTNRRRGSQPICFSSLCEGEVSQINKDIEAVYNHATPAPELGREWADRMKAKKGEETVRREMALVREYMEEFTQILRESQTSNYSKDKMEYLSTISHGFFPANILSNASVVQESARSAIESLDQNRVPFPGQFPVPPPAQAFPGYMQ